MRESKKTERMHLPRGSTETWLESQTPGNKSGRHGIPPPDTYETWVEKRVTKKRASKAAD